MQIDIKKPIGELLHFICTELNYSNAFVEGRYCLRTEQDEMITDEVRCSSSIDEASYNTRKFSAKSHLFTLL